MAQDVVIRTTMLASVLGVLLLGACLAVIATYRHTMETARRNELARLAQASLTDTLTGRGNHRAYQDDLERELARSDRHGGSVTLALIDIDNFKRGFRIALDDTGAGDAGLDFLRRLSVEFVKIDRMVVVQAMTDPIAHAIVTGVVEIARAMGSYVIAEGIETAEALAFVCTGVIQPSPEGFAISGAQGYLLGRPEVAPWTGAAAPTRALLTGACASALGANVCDPR